MMIIIKAIISIMIIMINRMKMLGSTNMITCQNIIINDCRNHHDHNDQNNKGPEYDQQGRLREPRPQGRALIKMVKMILIQKIDLN